MEYRFHALRRAPQGSFIEERAVHEFQIGSGDSIQILTAAARQIVENHNLVAEIEELG